MRPIECLWLIDDDPIFVDLTRRMIAKMHLVERIEVFENGQQALDHLHQVGADSQDFKFFRTENPKWLFFGCHPVCSGFFVVGGLDIYLAASFLILFIL